MYVDSFFRDTVASLRRSEEIRTSLVIMVLLARVHPCVGKTAPPHLTSYPEAATDGADFTLSCTLGQGRTLIGVAWYRNSVNMFVTSSDADVSATKLTPIASFPEHQSVSGRISVSSSLQQHNVTLRTYFTLDQGSVWRCRTGPQFSNNLTIEVKETIQDTSRAEGASSPGPVSTRDSTPFATEEQHTVPSSTDDKDMTTTNQTTTSTQTPLIETAEFISIVAGAAGVLVIVVVIVIVVLLCIRSRREGKCQTNEAGKDKGKEGGDNEEPERETIVMEDNDLYHGFVGIKNQESTAEQQVSDVYAKVNKVRKKHNATEVQITLSIEDLYAKPSKPARGNSEAASKVSSNQNADVNTPD